MKALPLLVISVALAVTPGLSLSQEQTQAHSNLSSEEAQEAAKTPPPQSTTPQSTPTQATPASTQTPPPEPPPPNLENTVQAAEPLPRRDLVHWNEYHGPHFTIRAGAGLLVDFASFAQDQESKEQIKMSPDVKLRDFRFIMGGKLPSLPLNTTWCAGVMYDAPTHSWFLRQTGIMFQVPRIFSYFFIGRQKEGFSLNKVMVGYDGWTMERFTMSDATIPLLADGFKWIGYSKKHGFLWNAGYYNDVASKGQSFSSYSSQEVARLAWLPVHSEENGTLFHLGFNFRYGKPVDGQLRLKSRPEAFIAPFFLDTGTFPAKSSDSEGYEVYFRRRSLLFGSEYYWQHVSSPSTGNPNFHGGDVVGTWVITGETRPYNTAAATSRT
jgi:phosphate-selective porin OprO/OprP